MKLRMTINFEDMPLKGVTLDGTTSIEYNSDSNMFITVDNKVFGVSDRDKSIRKNLEKKLQVTMLFLKECLTQNTEMYQDIDAYIMLDKPLKLKYSEDELDIIREYKRRYTRVTLYDIEDFGTSIIDQIIVDCTKEIMRKRGE